MTAPMDRPSRLTIKPAVPCLAVDANPLRDVVAQQYERWVYPEPITDLRAWLEHNWQWFDPRHAHPLFWPDRPYRSDISILIAGCGTNQAAVFAYTNPEARVVAVDVSQASLDHHRQLKARYGLENLELHQLPIEEVASLQREFDLIVSTGVLHHLASPEIGIQALADCLRSEGVMAIMLYARYGRIGVEMMQAIFREIGLEQNEASLFTVKEAIALLPADHPLRIYLSFAPDLRFDAGLVDTFLHGRDRSYTVEDCLNLVASAGLIFQDWFLNSCYYPPAPAQGGFYQAVAALPRRQQWAVMERFNTRNACHFFMACRSERPEHTYRLDFESEAVFSFVPQFRTRCGFDGGAVFRPDWRLELPAEHQGLVQQVNGQRTIGEILGEDVRSMDDPRLVLFRSLWQRDFLSMGLRP